MNLHITYICLSIFSKIGLVAQSKPCTQVYLQKFANSINLQLNVAIRISKNHAFRTCTTPLRTFMLILRSIGQLDIEIPRKEIISTDGRTTTIGSFFRKKNTKNEYFYNFFFQNFSKIFSKTHQLIAPFSNKLSGKHTHYIFRTPTPPPPPRNEILDIRAMH